MENEDQEEKPEECLQDVIEGTKEFLVGLRSLFEQGLQRIETKVERIETNVEKLSKRVGKVEKDVSRALNKLENQEPHLLKSGAMYEMMLRQELRTSRGELYARPFVVNDLYGLARLVAPKNIKFNENGVCEACSEGESTISLADRVDVLVEKAYKNVSKLRTWIRRERKKKTGKDIGKLNALTALLATYDSDEYKGKARKICFLRTSRLGLWAMTVDMYEGGKVEYNS